MLRLSRPTVQLWRQRFLGLREAAMQFISRVGHWLANSGLSISFPFNKALLALILSSVYLPSEASLQFPETGTESHQPKSHEGKTITASSVSSQPSVYEVLYSEDFSRGSRGWHYYAKSPFNNILSCIHSVPPDGCVIPCRWENGFIESRSPWWIDYNHKPPGAGLLNVLFVIWLDSYYGGLRQKSLDLRDARLHCRVMIAEANLKGNHVYFWFQTFNSEENKYHNYVLTKRPLDVSKAASSWRDVTIPINTDGADWTCLGSSQERSDKYACGSIEMDLQNVNANLGFIQMQVDPYDQPFGIVRLGRILIDRKVR